MTGSDNIIEAGHREGRRREAISQARSATARAGNRKRAAQPLMLLIACPKRSRRREAQPHALETESAQRNRSCRQPQARSDLARRAAQPIVLFTAGAKRKRLCWVVTWRIRGLVVYGCYHPVKPLGGGSAFEVCGDSPEELSA